MINVLLIVYLLSSIFNQVPLEAKSLLPEKISSQSFQTVHAVSFQANQSIPVGSSSISYPECQTNVKLQSVNDISLYDDDVSTVVEKHGLPKEIVSESDMEDYTVYKYADMNIYFIDGIIDYVEISGETETVTIDDSEITVSKDSIQEVLGEPDYIAEDGIVFQNNELLLKLFIDPDNGKLKSISYYHIASV